MATFTPIDKTKAPAAAASDPAAAPVVPGNEPAAAAPDKPIKFTPVSASATPAPATPDKPLTAGTVLKDIPKDIWHDFKTGHQNVMSAVFPRDKDGKPTSPDMLSGPKAALGAMEMMSAPMTGTAHAAIIEPIKNMFPKDSAVGNVVANTVGAAALMFGPSIIPEMTSAIATAPTAVRNMLESGVQLTLGQISGKIAKRLEEGAKSVPLLGHFIREAEGRTFDSMNVAAVNKSLKQIGVKVDAKNGREAVTKGQKAIDDHYDAVRSEITALHQDTIFDADMRRFKMDMEEMSPVLEKRLQAVIDNRIMPKFGYVQFMDGPEFVQADKELRELANAGKTSQDAAEQQFGYKIDELRGYLMDTAERQYPAFADDLRDVKYAFSQFADVQRAASASAISAGRFTPGQLLQSIKRADKSARDHNFAEGTRDLQRWAEDAHDVIGNKLPDSGTAERAMIELGATGGIGHYDPTGAYVPTVAAGAALYSKPGQAATNAAAKGAPIVSDAVKQLTRQSGPAAAVAEAGQQTQ